ncbi:MAG TPA: uroporphyrinogen-III C-methyltransferase, partial [Azonexus sp.]
LQTMYDDLARGREEATLLEVEQALTLAAQQLQLAGNVSVAALALQTADARLARLDKPRYLPLRSALAKDLARLNALPFVDVSGISLRLEEIIGGVDKFALAALGRPAAGAAPAPAEPAAAAPWWRLAAADVWQELRGLIRIQRFDREDAALLAPGQSFFLRENLKLRLLNARLALLARDHGTYRSELKVAQAWLKRHFAADDPAVQAAQGKLLQLLAADPGVELPGLNDSLAALAKLRGGKDRR